MRRSAVLVRWVARATRADAIAFLVPRAVAIGLVAVELDVIVSWRGVAAEAARAPAGAAGAVVAAACALAALDGRRFVAKVLLGPRLAALRRQPIPGPAWGPATLPVLLPVVAPVAALAAGLHAAAVVPTLLWSALALPPALAVAAGRWGWALLAIAAAGAIAAADHVARGPWEAIVAGVVPLLGVACARWAQDGPGSPVAALPARPRGPIGALLHRDLLVVWRAERGVLWQALGGAGVVGIVAAGMARSGDWGGPALTAGALVALALGGPGALAAVTAVARQLGRRFDPPEWPTTAGQRALALAGVAALALSPGWAAAAVAAPPIGLGHLRIGAFVAAVAGGAAWWVASRPTRPNPGTWPYWLGLCLGAALVPGGAAWATGLGGVALYAAARALAARRGRP